MCFFCWCRVVQSFVTRHFTTTTKRQHGRPLIRLLVLVLGSNYSSVTILLLVGCTDCLVSRGTCVYVCVCGRMAWSFLHSFVAFLDETRSRSLVIRRLSMCPIFKKALSLLEYKGYDRYCFQEDRWVGFSLLLQPKQRQQQQRW